MRFVIQRVTEAKCEVDHAITGQIINGFCVLIGIAESDTTAIADKMIRKLLGMRIFSDENGKTNLALHDIDGSLLLISQFGIFGADMKISLVNDGPFTIILDSEDLV